MKRIVLYCLILAGVLLIPVERTDISSLEPIQAVWMYKDGENLTLQTDTDDTGTGRTAQEALSEMKYHSSGIVYLDTAEFLLVSSSAIEYIAEMKSILKGSVKICLWEGEGELSEAAAYMQAHKTGCRLDQWQPQVKLPKMPEQTGEKKG